MIDVKDGEDGEDTSLIQPNLQNPESPQNQESIHPRESPQDTNILPSIQKLPKPKGGFRVGSGAKKMSVNPTDRMNQHLLYAVRRNWRPMYEKQIERARAGHFTSFQYLTDRVLGKPVESIRLVQTVRLLMDE